jgi:hypothetical protein
MLGNFSRNGRGLALIQAIKQAQGPDKYLDAEIYEFLSGKRIKIGSGPKYTQDLDDASSVVPANHSWCVGYTAKTSHTAGTMDSEVGFYADVRSLQSNLYIWHKNYATHKHSPMLALLIAAINAIMDGKK